MQIAGFAFLLGGVTMFAYQIWSWWRHRQQVMSALPPYSLNMAYKEGKQQTLACMPYMAKLAWMASNSATVPERLRG